MSMEKESSRRDFLRQGGYGLVGLLVYASVGYGNNASKRRPNIFFAIADDWSWPHASIAGDRVVKTPNFDRVAGNGILFTNAFVSAPSCTPSRGAILTGQYHWRLGPGGNLWSSLPEEHRTYPNILEDNGYFVGSCRKAWGPGRERPRPAAGMAYQDMEEFLQKRPKDKPFCFWSGSPDPHRVYEWQSGIKSGMKLAEVKVPPCLPDNTIVRTDICDYYWEVQRFDREVGEQLKLLEQAGELDNTIVVITSDNGWPFPRGKANLYDLGTHVPLAIQWGEVIPKGRIVEDFVSLSDLAPTFLEAAGLKTPAAMTGRSLMNILKSRKSGLVDSARDHVLTGKERHTLAQSENRGGTPMRAIRTRDFLYINNFKPERWPAGGPTSIFGPAYADIDNSPTKEYILEHGDEAEVKRFFELACGKRPADELYDLKKDPHELNNVADDPGYADVLKKLKDRLMKELRDTEDPRALGQGDLFDDYPYYGPLKKKKS